MNNDQILNICSNYTMTSRERQENCIYAIEHIIRHNVKGDIIEIGVWRGGCIMIMLYKLMLLGITDRQIHLYDTFTGMTESTSEDIDRNYNLADYNAPGIKCECGYEEVYENIKSTGYPMNNIHFHIGDIRNIQNQDISRNIAVLRLDNDWYDLYKFELPIFEPKVNMNGIIIIDDYGYWKGCKKAVDEYIDTIIYKPDIQIVDDCGIYWIKP